MVRISRWENPCTKKAGILGELGTDDFVNEDPDQTVRFFVIIGQDVRV